MHLRHRVTELVRERSNVGGVVCDTPEGRRSFGGAVVLATSARDWDPELWATYSGIPAGHSGSVAPPTIRGDAIRLASSVGAHVVALPPETMPNVPGYRASEPDGEDIGFRIATKSALPQCFMVNRMGRRFCDDSGFAQNTTRAVLGARASDGTLKNVPFFLIWDSQHHRKCGFGRVAPGAPYPSSLGVHTAPSLPALAEQFNIDPQGLTETAARFNDFAASGADPDFGRGSRVTARLLRGDPTSPNPLLGSVVEPPFDGMQLRLLGTAIGAAGIRAGASGEALRPDGTRVPGLYAVGCAAAATTSGAGYNSGFALSRAVTFAWLAARDVARVE